MPFKSTAQQKYLFAKKPEIAKEFAQDTSEAQFHRLPKHVKKKKIKLLTRLKSLPKEI